ncbi:MAG TPA: TIM-barrel domain-containing protein [Acidobacteriaceae bacterium]|nr:TIM-barrel domain-containing protein [Acidobacteriaceae bacterium]
MVNRRSLLKGSVVALAGSASAKLGADPAGPLTGADEAIAERSISFSPVHPGIWKATIGNPENYTPVSGRTIAPDAKAIQQLPALTEAPFASISGKVDSRGCLITLPLDEHEEIFGFGLQMLSFAQRGKKKTVRVNADPKVDSGDSHAPAPFYVSTKGYGVLVDTCRYASFYCGDARRKPSHSASTPKSANVQTPGSTRNVQAGEPSHMLVDIPRASGVDVYLFAGPAMLDAVRRYNLFSGGGVEPPEWGLGFWYRAVGTANSSEALAIARDLRDSKIPCDVLGLEPGWQSHAYSCSFVWDKGRFPDPAGFIKDATALGYRVNLWEHAFTHLSSPLFDPLHPHSGDYGVWGGLVPDFAGKPAREIFGEYHGKNFVDLGVSGFKLDECDNSDFTKGWSFPEFSSFPSGVDGEQMHSVFGLRYQDAILDQFESRGKQTYSLVRSSGALAAPYPFVLYSDLYGHRDFVRALVNSGFSGLLWCPEVRDATSSEDLIRRLQTAVFSPLAMVNAWYIKNPPWKQIDQKKNNAGELAEGWQELERRCRDLIEWRMKLVPYLRGAFAKYALDGTPPFRALALDFPNDQKLHTVDDQYMVGDRMLVAPLFAGEASRKVVLPAGAWHDFWSGKPYEGGRAYTVSSEQENIPVFVKAGSIVPLGGVGMTTDAESTRGLTVAVFGDGSMPWRLEGSSGFELRQSASGRIEARSTGAKPHGYRVGEVKQMGKS